MKITYIAQKCKVNKTAFIVDRGDCQFLGNGHAMYKVPGLPELDPGNIPALFSLSDKDWLEKWNSQRIPAESTGVSFDDYVHMDESTKQPYTSIVSNGEILRSFVGERTAEMIFIKSWYVENFDPEITEYYIRRTNSGNPVLVAKQGMLTEAVIYPVSIAPIALSNKMQEFAAAIERQCRNYERVNDSIQTEFDEESFEYEDDENEDE